MSTSVTSRSVTVTWGTIDCIQRNGEITGYVVQYEGGDMTDGGMTDVNTRTFEATGLRPFTVYTFQVAGVNDVDTGPFAETIIITEEDGVTIIILLLLIM